MSATLRSFWVAAHRWAGLALAGFLLVAGASGSVIAFQDEIDAWLNPGWFRVSPGPSRLALAEMAHRAEAHVPGTWTRKVALPATADGAVRLQLRSLPAPSAQGARPRDLEAFFDPYRGVVLGFRDRQRFALDRRHAIPSLRKLHESLYLGQPGEWLLGAVALLWLMDHAAGAWLAAPRRALLRRSLTVRRRSGAAALAYEAHRAGGLWLLPLTALLAASGGYLAFKEPLREALGAVTRLTPDVNKVLPALAQPLVRAPLTFDEALLGARTALPGLAPESVTLDQRTGVYRVRLIGDGVGDAAQSAVYIDAASGRVVAIRERSVITATDRVLDWMLPLHSGGAFGVPGRAVVSAAGIAVTVLVASGLALWATRRGQRARRASRVPAGAVAPTSQLSSTPLSPAPPAGAAKAYGRPAAVLAERERQ